MGDDRLPGTGSVETRHWVCPRRGCDEDDYASSAPRCPDHDDLMVLVRT